jgi:hypothetical protein
MSSTEMLTGNSLTKKLWQLTGWRAVGQTTAFGRVFDRGGVHFPEEFLGRDTKGDSITFDFLGKMTGVPIGEGGTLDGNEKRLDLGNFSMVVNESRDAILIPNSGIEPQRTQVNMGKAAKTVLPDRAAELIDTSMFQQLGGADPTSFTVNATTYASSADKLHVTGHNSIVAASTSRIVRAASAATDQALTSADKFTLPLIDYAIELNAVSEQPIKPFSDNTFDLFLHPYCVTDLQLDGTSAIQWSAIELARLEAASKNGFDGAKFDNKVRIVGRYREVNILSAPRVSQGVNASTSAVITTVRRNVLVGQNALSFASPYGGRPEDDDVPYRLITQLKDYEKYKGLGFEMVYGLKKNTPSNGIDVGSMVLGCYAAAHT